MITEESVELLASALMRVATSITPNASPGRDASDGYVASLTEAVMGITDGLFRIAESIDGLAAAVSDMSAESEVTA